MELNNFIFPAPQCNYTNNTVRSLVLVPRKARKSVEASVEQQTKPASAQEEELEVKRKASSIIDDKPKSNIKITKQVIIRNHKFYIPKTLFFREKLYSLPLHAIRERSQRKL